MIYPSPEYSDGTDPQGIDYQRIDQLAAAEVARVYTVFTEAVAKHQQGRVIAQAKRDYEPIFLAATQVIEKVYYTRYPDPVNKDTEIHLHKLIEVFDLGHIPVSWTMTNSPDFVRSLGDAELDSMLVGNGKVAEELLASIQESFWGSFLINRVVAELGYQVEVILSETTKMSAGKRKRKRGEVTDDRTESEQDSDQEVAHVFDVQEAAAFREAIKIFIQSHPHLVAKIAQFFDPQRPSSSFDLHQIFEQEDLESFFDFIQHGQIRFKALTKAEWVAAFWKREWSNIGFPTQRGLNGAWLKINQAVFPTDLALAVLPAEVEVSDLERLKKQAGNAELRTTPVIEMRQAQQMTEAYRWLQKMNDRVVQYKQELAKRPDDPSLDNALVIAECVSLLIEAEDLFHKLKSSLLEEVDGSIGEPAVDEWVSEYQTRFQEAVSSLVQDSGENLVRKMSHLYGVLSGQTESWKDGGQAKSFIKYAEKAQKKKYAVADLFEEFERQLRALPGLAQLQTISLDLAARKAKEVMLVKSVIPAILARHKELAGRANTTVIIQQIVDNVDEIIGSDGELLFSVDELIKRCASGSTSR